MGFHGTDRIHPTEFGRFTAKDPAGAAFGSEGWVTFADETGGRFSLTYCCSYKTEGNYCFLVEPSPLLEVTLRFGNEVPWNRCHPNLETAPTPARSGYVSRP